MLSAVLRKRIVALAVATGCSGHHSTLRSDAGADAFTSDTSASECGQLVPARLHTIDQVKSALRSSRAFPFPGGWHPCSGHGFCTTPDAPAMSFATDLSQASCGAGYESGFVPMFNYPMTIEQLATDLFAIDVELTTSQHSKFIVQALGSAEAPGELRLIDDAKLEATNYRPLPPLP
jgi:hypothetical protein